MTAHELERTIAQWLVEEAPASAPDRIVVALSDRITSIEQRRPLAAGRGAMFRTTSRLLAAAVIAGLIILAGALAAGRMGPAPTPSPTPVASAATSPSPAASQAPGTPVPSATVPPLGVGARLDIDLAALGIDGITNGISDMAIGPDGNLYVMTSRAVVVLAPDGSVVRQWGRLGTGPGELNAQVGARGIAVAPDGTVWLSEGLGSDFTTAPPRVMAYTATGGYLRSIGSVGGGAGQFRDAFDVEVGPDGTVYVTDDVMGVIDRYSPDGTFLGVVGAPGNGPGQMNNTGRSRVGPDGTVYNVEGTNDRLQAWTADGTFLWVLGSGLFLGIRDVAPLTSGNLYVIDAARIALIDPQGHRLGALKPPARGLSILATDGTYLWVGGTDWAVSATLIRYTIAP